MPVLVEVLRKGKDLFFGRTDGWYVMSNGRRYDPGASFDLSFGTLVFEEDGYETAFDFNQTAALASKNARLWIKCFDKGTKLHIAMRESEPRPLLLSADARRVKASERQKQLALTRKSSSFRLAPSQYQRSILRVRIGDVLFRANDWHPSTEDQDTLQLTISFRDCVPEHIYARRKSVQVAPACEYETHGVDLGVSLLRINDQVSRVIKVDEDGLGVREGIQVGDLLLTNEVNGREYPFASSTVRRWRRMETRRVTFDAFIEFPYESEEDEQNVDDNTTLADQMLTVSLRLTPSPDSLSSDENVRPLEELFGTEPSLEMNGVGNCRLVFPINLLTMNAGVSFCTAKNYIDLVDPEVFLGYERVLLSDICNWRVNLQASMSVSLLATCVTSTESAARRHSDLGLLSFRGIQVMGEMYADNTTNMEASLKSFQVDDQRPEAAFPVAIFPTPLVDISPDAPSVRTFLSVRRSDPAFLNVKAFEFFVTETTLRLHESFLMSLVDFGLELSSRRPEEPFTPGIVLDADVNSNSSREVRAPVQTDLSEKTQMRKIYVDSADFKPMRFNITFQSAALASEKRVQLLIRRFPLFSALITAVASVSDAPLRLGAVRLRRESKSAEALLFAVAKYYSGEMTRGILSIAGSTDILGSPVHLLGSVSHGAFSFFYEPALALSLGYGELGRGLTRGGMELISSSAGGVFDSLSKISNVVAKAVAQMCYDPVFARALEIQLKAGGFTEPINLREGVSNGFLLVIRSILDAVVGLVPSKNKQHQRRKVTNSKRRKVSSALQPLLALILKPTAGFFAALNQLSVGIRNALSVGPHQSCFALRLPRPREAKVLPYSASRSAGYLLARHRFELDVKFVLNEICQLEIPINDQLVHSIVATVVVTSDWIVACRETLLDVWAIPLELVENAVGDDTHFVFTALGQQYKLRCRVKLDVLAMQKAIQFAKEMRRGLISPGESFLDELPRKARPSLSATSMWDNRSRRSSLRRLVDPDDPTKDLGITGGSELDVAGCRVSSAEIQSAGYWPDWVYRYRIRMVSVDGKVEWIIERRYSEFLKFRDQACKFLGVSRRSIPLPGRRPWHLTVAEQEERWKGLQNMLDLSLKIDLLAESEVLRAFLTRGADFVVVKE